MFFNGLRIHETDAVIRQVAYWHIVPAHPLYQWLAQTRLGRWLKVPFWAWYPSTVEVHEAVIDGRRGVIYMSRLMTIELRNDNRVVKWDCWT